MPRTKKKIKSKMNKIDLVKIINDNGLDDVFVAKQLFPGNKYPAMALARIKAGGAELSASQVLTLSKLTGLNLAEVYGIVEWVASTSDGVHIFSNGKYRAELDTKKWVTRIYIENDCISESIIHNATITLGDYVNELNKTINKLKK